MSHRALENMEHDAAGLGAKILRFAQNDNLTVILREERPKDLSFGSQRRFFASLRMTKGGAQNDRQERFFASLRMTDKGAQNDRQERFFASLRMTDKGAQNDRHDKEDRHWT